MYGNIHVRTPEEQALVALIRNEPLAPILASCKAEELSHLAGTHKVCSLLASALLQEAGMPDHWRRWAMVSAMAAERDARILALALKKTLAILESKGISPIVLKGPSLSLGKPRDAGDIDLLIPQPCLVQAVSLLEAAGFVYKGYERNMYIRQSEYRDWENLARWSNQFEFTDPDTGALVELHTAFFETRRIYAEDLAPLRAAMAEFMASSVVDASTGYRFLTLEDRALLLALHAGIKRAPVKKQFILRHLTDLQALVKAGLNWNQLGHRAFRFHATHHLVLLLRLAESFAGPCAPSGYIAGLEASLSPTMLWLLQVHQRCLKGLDWYDPLAIFSYRLFSPFILKGTPYSRLQALLVFPLLFPPRHTLARRYGLHPRSRLTFLLYPLEPAQWLFRLFRKALRAMWRIPLQRTR